MIKQFNTFDEDYDAIPTSRRTTTATAAAPATAQPEPTSVGADLSFDDPNISEVVKAVDVLPVVKIEKGTVARFALVPGVPLKQAMTHYVQGQGTLICHSTKGRTAACCKNEQPRPRFVALVFRYVNVDPKSGKFPAGVDRPQIEIQAVRLSKTNVRDILDSVDEGGSAYTIDLKMKHDEGRSIGYKFSRIAPKNAWRATPALEAEALAMAEPYKDGVKLATRLGKKLNATELNAALESGSASEETKQSMETMLSAMDDSE